jgi:hypothetical protein
MITQNVSFTHSTFALESIKEGIRSMHRLYDWAKTSLHSQTIIGESDIA